MLILLAHMILLLEIQLFMIIRNVEFFTRPFIRSLYWRKSLLFEINGINIYMQNQPLISFDNSLGRYLTKKRKKNRSYLSDIVSS